MSKAPITDRSEARQRLLKTTQARVVRVEHDGESYLLKAPTLAQKAEIDRASFRFEGRDVRFDPTAQRVHALVACLHVAGADGEPAATVFEASDIEALLGSPAGGGGVVEALGAKAVEMLGTADQKAAVETAKNG